MPSYDLMCEDCGCQFSVFCSISDKEKQRCPQCNSDSLTSIFSNVNIGKGGKPGATPNSGSPG